MIRRDVGTDGKLFHPILELFYVKESWEFIAAIWNLMSIISPGVGKLRRCDMGSRLKQSGGPEAIVASEAKLSRARCLSAVTPKSVSKGILQFKRS